MTASLEVPNRETDRSNPIAEQKVPYDSTFYSWHEKHTRSSAEVIVPLLLKLIRPHSVVDVGCGTGIWLSVFRQNGVTDVHGFDGPWVDRQKLQVPTECFTHWDLSKPLQWDRRFDLVTSFEVAEHLPEASADTFVDSLTRLGDVIAFSAAIPGQGGDGHVNEQWQDYWATRFRKRGYLPSNALRWPIWLDERVLYWYRQDLVLYIHESARNHFPDLVDDKSGSDHALSVVHPRHYMNRIGAYEVMGLRDATRLWFRTLGRSLRRWFTGKGPARPQKPWETR